MEKEVTEVLEEGVVNELEEVNYKASKATIFGAAALVVTGLLIAFRKKIGARVEKSMVKKLTKKGYTIQEPKPEDFFEMTEIVE